MQKGACKLSSGKQVRVHCALTAGEKSVETRPPPAGFWNPAQCSLGLIKVSLEGTFEIINPQPCFINENTGIQRG